MTGAAEPPVGVGAGRRAWLGLAVLGLPTLLLALDLSVVYLALPLISVDLGANATQQLWIADIYGFVTAGFLVTMGTLGDRIGRRKLLLIGAAAFGLTSVCAAYSRSVGALIAARALMGVAGATLMPSTLALITTMFTDRRERASAIAVWTGCFMVGAAIGPIVGGLLLEHFWWGSLFLISVPVMLLLLVSGPFLLPEFKRSGADRIDILSVCLSFTAVLPVIYAIKALARAGPSRVAIAAAIVGVAAGCAFVARQRRLAAPVLDVRLFRHRELSATLLIFMIGLAAQGGITLLLSEQLQLVDGLSPLRAGWTLMPASVAMVVVCILTPVTVRWIRPGWTIGAGLVVSAVGYAALARLSAAPDLVALTIGTILVFVGIAPMAVFSQDLIVGSVPADQAGSAAALSETSGDFGMALGVAALGSINTAFYSRGISKAVIGLPTSLAALGRQSLAGATQAASQLPDPVGRALLATARDAFTAGFRAAAIAGGLATLCLAVIAVATLSRKAPPPDGAH